MTGAVPNARITVACVSGTPGPTNDLEVDSTWWCKNFPPVSANNRLTTDRIGGAAEEKEGVGEQTASDSECAREGGVANKERRAVMADQRRKSFSGGDLIAATEDFQPNSRADRIEERGRNRVRKQGSHNGRRPIQAQATR